MELVDLVAELVMLMLLVLVLLPLLVVELMKQERSHSHPSLRLVAGNVGAGAPWRLCGSL